MKALSLKQPFAELILQGKKKIELRTWNTKFRGEFLIHASKIPDKNAMKEFGFDDLPCGFILGKAELVYVKKYESKSAHEKDKKLHLGSEDWGDYGFVLENVRRIKLVSCKGRLGFWNFEGDIKCL
ncbi:MAG: ASCH domain-containing protein [Nanoarchaeota archaeon]|nr:ASCH domain-containing protein [Nanoarchaeota archaeon]